MPDRILDALANVVWSVPGRVGASGAVGAWIWWWIGRVAGVLSEKTKQDIGLWPLASEDRVSEFQATARRWPEIFVTIFDQVFGLKHISWYGFRRSCIVLICGVGLMFVFWVLIYPHQRVAYFRLNPHSVVEYIVPVLIVSILPHYLSLLKSRRIIGVRARTNAAARVGLIVIDFLLALRIAVGASEVFKLRRHLR